MSTINRFNSDTIEAMFQNGRIIAIVAAGYMPWVTGYVLNPAGGPRKMGAIYDKYDGQWHRLPKWVPVRKFITADGTVISDKEMIDHIGWMNTHIGSVLRWADEYVPGAEW